MEILIAFIKALPISKASYFFYIKNVKPINRKSEMPKSSTRELLRHCLRLRGSLSLFALFFNNLSSLRFFQWKAHQYPPFCFPLCVGNPVVLN